MNFSDPTQLAAYIKAHPDLSSTLQGIFTRGGEWSNNGTYNAQTDTYSPASEFYTNKVDIGGRRHTADVYGPDGKFIKTTDPIDPGNMGREALKGLAMVGGTALGINGLFNPAGAAGTFGGGAGGVNGAVDSAALGLDGAAGTAAGSAPFDMYAGGNGALMSEFGNGVGAAGAALGGAGGAAAGGAAAGGISNAAGGATLGGTAAGLGAAGAASSLIPGITNGQLLATAAPLVGGALSANAAGNAAETQANATRDSNALLKYIYDNNVRLNQPAIDAGNTARTEYLRQMGLGGDANSAGYGALSKPFTGADLASEPGYQFGLDHRRR